MHHSSNPDHIVANSRRLVDSSKVHLVVDFIFNERGLLDCKQNDTAWCETKMFLKSPASQVKHWSINKKQNADYIRNTAVKHFNNTIEVMLPESAVFWLLSVFPWLHVIVSLCNPTGTMSMFCTVYSPVFVSDGAEWSVIWPSFLGLPH